MGWLEDFFTNPWVSPAGWFSSGVYKDLKLLNEIKSHDDMDDQEKARAARRQLTYAGLGLLSLVAAPSIYAMTLKKRKLRPKEERLGISLENSSAQATNVVISALAAPPIASAAAYILVQKLEDGQFISKSLGNSAQSLLAVTAAAPMIQGIGNAIGSAFRMGK